MNANWYITGTHWIRCEIVSRIGSLAVVRLYNDAAHTYRGRVRKGLYGLLVEQI